MPLRVGLHGNVRTGGKSSYMLFFIVLKHFEVGLLQVVDVCALFVCHYGIDQD